MQQTIIRPAHVGVILVNYGIADDTINCVTALNRLTEPPHRLVIVDNGSAESAVAPLRKHLAKTPSRMRTELIELTENTGFSGGNNAAMHVLLGDAECHAFWLLNNDTEPDPDALTALCDALNKQEHPGACGSLLIHRRGDEHVQCTAGGTLHKWLGTATHLGEGLTVHEAQSLPVRPLEEQLDYICGASLLIPSATVQQIGMLNKTFFLYYEDVEWGIRIRRAGYTLGYAPRSIVLHKEGGSTGADGTPPTRSKFIDYLALRNRVWLMRTAFPLALPFVLISYLGVAFNRFRRGQGDRIPLVLRAMWHGLTGQIGKPKQDDRLA